MAIEGIKSNIVNQVTRIEPKVAIESDNVAVDSSAKGFEPIMATQGSGSQNMGQKKDQEEEKDLRDVSPDRIKNVLSDINHRIRPTHTQCEFKYHEKTNRISITVRDSETDEVIREIPPEKTLDIIAKSLELAGILVDEKR